MIDIYNEDCRITISKLKEQSIDLVLTSPPYNTSRKVKTKKEIKEHKSKYGDYDDTMPNDEYIKFIVEVINGLNKVLVKNGVVLINLSYASSIEIGSKCTDMIKLLYEIVDKTAFEIADIITWKKNSAIPLNRNANKLTRICEYIFVLCRKSEYTTFYANKPLTSFIEEKNLKYYANIYNFIEAKNNDGSNPYNKATYSSELCEKLLKIYTKKNFTIYDPFIGTGTTAVACKRLGLNCIGSEISKDQVDYAKKRLENINVQLSILD